MKYYVNNAEALIKTIESDVCKNIVDFNVKFGIYAVFPEKQIQEYLGSRYGYGSEFILSLSSQNDHNNPIQNKNRIILKIFNDLIS